MSPYSFVQRSCTLSSSRLSVFLSFTSVSIVYATPEGATTPVSLNRGILRTQSPLRHAATPLRNSGHRQRSSSMCEYSLPRASENLRGRQSQFRASKQSLVLSIVRVQKDVEPDSDAGPDSDSDSEVPAYVYEKPKS